MSGSESKSGQETSSPKEDGPTSLAEFLAPPRSRSSVPAPSGIAAKTAAFAPAPLATEPELEWDDPSSAVTPTEPTRFSDAPPAQIATSAPRDAEPRAMLAPTPSSSIDARSLIPVATSSSSDADAPDALDDEFGLPVQGAPFSGAAVRRATFVALLAAAAAVPAWVVFRTRSVDVQARSDSPVKIAAASAGPHTLQLVREIEADDDRAEPGPATSTAVAVDPVKGLELRQEARRLLEAGQIDQGVATARHAIELNPADPECYVLLAAGLQDQGRWAESREVFSRCIRKSNSIINAECAYFATSGTSAHR